jgi:hypothetical protein
LFDISPLEVCDFILGQPYLWNHHVVYECIPLSVIITLVTILYRIPEIASPTTIYLIYSKQCSKVISKTKKFILFFIRAHNKQRFATTYVAYKQKQVNKIVKDYIYIFSSPTEVPMHCQVKHPIDITPSAPPPNGPILSSLIDGK